MTRLSEALDRARAGDSLASAAPGASGAELNPLVLRRALTPDAPSTVAEAAVPDPRRLSGRSSGESLWFTLTPKRHSSSNFVVWLPPSIIRRRRAIRGRS